MHVIYISMFILHSPLTTNIPIPSTSQSLLHVSLHALSLIHLHCPASLQACLTDRWPRKIKALMWTHLTVKCVYRRWFYLWSDEWYVIQVPWPQTALRQDSHDRYYVARWFHKLVSHVGVVAHEGFYCTFIQQVPNSQWLQCTNVPNIRTRLPKVRHSKNHRAWLLKWCLHGAVNYWPYSNESL